MDAEIKEDDGGKKSLGNENAKGYCQQIHTKEERRREERRGGRCQNRHDVAGCAPSRNLSRH